MPGFLPPKSPRIGEARRRLEDALLAERRRAEVEAQVRIRELFTLSFFQRAGFSGGSLTARKRLRGGGLRV